jgi:hypothetical protein
MGCDLFTGEQKDRREMLKVRDANREIHEIHETRDFTAESAEKKFLSANCQTDHGVIAR